MANITGTNGNDSLDGTTAADEILGLGGDDTINGDSGDDTIAGGAGTNVLNGGSGDDVFIGGDGADRFQGNNGQDNLDYTGSGAAVNVNLSTGNLSGGDADNDSIDGGIDGVFGSDFGDVLTGFDQSGSTATDTFTNELFGYGGDDTITGLGGDDLLDGGDGDDVIDGGSGDDSIFGGQGNDTLSGSSGNDIIEDLDGDNLIDAGILGTPDLGFPIIGGPDANPSNDLDTVTTGAGDDTISTGDDDDVINAGDGNNVIDGGFDRDDITSGSGNDAITSGEGSDTVNSGGGDDTIYGGLGPVLGSNANLIDENADPTRNDDILDNGDDLIDAGAGDDVVFGEDDNDTIDGGAGDDTLDGGVDDDTIFGGEGSDEIIGGQGADSLDGGTGDDVFNVGTFTDPIFGDEYVEGLGDTIVGGEDAGDGDIDTLDLNGSVDFDILFEDSIDPSGTTGESGRVVFYTDDTKDVVKGELIFKEIENVIPCFTPGSMIATPRGEVPVETLRIGDKVITRDNGIQTICWTSSRTLNREELAEGRNLKPILIKAGSFGKNQPERDMLVSPQHRVLITNNASQLYFDESEVLVAAKHLVGKQGVSIMDTMRTTYIHFMFERHEVVLSDGVWTESFQPGDQSLGSMGEARRDEIFAVFPELATAKGLTNYAAARRSLKAHEAKLLQL